MGRRYELLRMIRGGHTFKNGIFETYDDALKAKAHGEQWHKANRTSSKFLIRYEDSPEDLADDYVPPEELDYDEVPALPEENAELRIKQLEAELARKEKLLLSLSAQEEPVEPEEVEEEQKGRRKRANADS